MVRPSAGPTKKINKREEKKKKEERGIRAVVWGLQSEGEEGLREGSIVMAKVILFFVLKAS